MTPYYEDKSAGITIYCGDCLDLLDVIEIPSVLVTDPPFGINYQSGHYGTLQRSIKGDLDTTLRDDVLRWWGDRPAIVFGSWRAERPHNTRMLLVWDTKGALGMGALDLPWKPAHQEIYVIGKGFEGRRTTDVLVHAPVQSMAKNGRTHPHEKPVSLMSELIAKCPAGLIGDPFMGSGSTLVAAKLSGRRAIGIDVDEGYCATAVERLRQGVLPLPT